MSRSPSVGTPRNDRERDRPRPERSTSASVRSVSITRLNPAGPQEAADWRQALENVENRVEALERYSRLLAQGIATTDAEVKVLRDDCRKAEEDRSNYKTYVQNRFTNMEQVITKELSDVKTLMDHVGIEEKFKDMWEKIGLIAAQLSELLRVFNHRGGPTIYEMGTPAEASDAARGSRDPAPRAEASQQAGPTPTGGDVRT